MFLRHEGFLGAMGAFLKVHPMEPNMEAASAKEPRKVLLLSHLDRSLPHTPIAQELMILQEGNTMVVATRTIFQAKQDDPGNTQAYFSLQARVHAEAW